MVVLLVRDDLWQFAVLDGEGCLPRTILSQCITVPCEKPLYAKVGIFCRYFLNDIVADGFVGVFLLGKVAIGYP